MKKNLHQLSCVIVFIAAGIFYLITPISAQHNLLLGAGNGYVNITKKTTGGAVQNGDVLEIRNTYYFGPGYNSNSIYKVRYYDSVPLKTTMNTGATDSLRLITNEGLTVKNYSLAAADDAGVYTPAPAAGRYQVRINISAAPGAAGDPGTNAGLLTSNNNAGNIVIGSYVPKIFGGVLLTTAFRVTVTGNPGDTIILGTGKLAYKNSSAAGAVDTIVNSTPYKIFIDSTSAALCINGLGNNLAQEAGGTFDSGSVQNRSYGPAFAIPAYDYKLVSISTATGDGSYAIVNNSSPSASTNINARMSPNCAVPAGPILTTDSCSKRMFGGFWEIMGDHTGTNNATGNPPPAAGTKGGYMLMVNADVVTSEAYRQTVSGLCSDTYYEFSAWLKNICKRCGIDQNSTSTYKIGVMPNLTFSVNGIDIYSSGELDSLGWVKKGFVFRTGPSQTTAVISIRNNAPGGGGNDWVMDDIAIGTCGPSSNMNYKPIALGCSTGSTFTLADTIRYSYNPKYSFYKWERSTDGGLTWGAPPQPIPNSGSAIIGPKMGGFYEFTTTFGPILVTAADSGHLYRVIVGTNAANLNSTTCRFNDGSSIMIKVISCPGALDANIVSFSARLDNNNKSILNWIASDETNIIKYEMEKSTDGIFFNKIGTRQSNKATGLQEYSFTDNSLVKGYCYFRLKVYTDNGLFKYTKTVIVNFNLSFEVSKLINPFKQVIFAGIILPADGIVSMKLYNNTGQLLYNEDRKMNKGLNEVQYSGYNNLSQGIYFISFQTGSIIIQKKLLKL